MAHACSLLPPHLVSLALKKKEKKKKRQVEQQFFFLYTISTEHASVIFLSSLRIFFLGWLRFAISDRCILYVTLYREAGHKDRQRGLRHFGYNELGEFVD